MKKTNWYVLTGPPCSGKTTLINALRDKGYTISEEVARTHYLDLISHYTQKKVLSDPVQLQEDILQIEIKREQSLDPNELIFFDRALPDSIAYYQQLGKVPQHVTKAAKLNHYKGVFFLEALPYEKDIIRTEDEKTARAIGRLIRLAYESLGYQLIDVPAVSVEQRLEKILNVINPQHK